MPKALRTNRTVIYFLRGLNNIFASRLGFFIVRNRWLLRNSHRTIGNGEEGAGANYARHINICPPPGFQIFLRSCHNTYKHECYTELILFYAQLLTTESMAKNFERLRVSVFRPCSKEKHKDRNMQPLKIV